MEILDRNKTEKTEGNPGDNPGNENDETLDRLHALRNVERSPRKVRALLIQITFDSDEAEQKIYDRAFLEMSSWFIERDSESLGPYLKVITEDGTFAIKLERISE